MLNLLGGGASDGSSDGSKIKTSYTLPPRVSSPSNETGALSVPSVPQADGARHSRQPPRARPQARRLLPRLGEACSAWQEGRVTAASWRVAVPESRALDGVVQARWNVIDDRRIRFSNLRIGITVPSAQAEEAIRRKFASYMDFHLAGENSTRRSETGSPNLVGRQN